MRGLSSSAFPTALNHLRPLERKVASSVLRLLSDLPGLNAIVLGGSSVLDRPRPDGDVDFWVFVEDAELAAHALMTAATHLDELVHLCDGGHLPWFGRLLTFLFLPDCSFSVDVGLTTHAGADDINTGPGAVVLWSNGRANVSLERALVRRAFRKRVERRVESVLINLIKLNKAVSREEYWGAVEYIVRSRREVLGMIRDKKSGISEWYERPDREVASMLTTEQTADLLSTHGELDARGLAVSGRNLARLALKYSRLADDSPLRAAVQKVALRLAGTTRGLLPITGILGVGRMGSAIAGNLLELGGQVLVCDIDADRTRELMKLGAEVVTPDKLWKDSEVILVALPNETTAASAIEKMVTTDHRRRLVVDISTNSPARAKMLAALCERAGHGFLDAPMSGGIWGANEGRLTLMVGGAEADFAAAKSLLCAIAQTIVHVGSVGAGCAAKLIHNMVGEIEVQAFAEAFCAGGKLGLAPNRLFDCLANGMASSRVLTNLFREGVFTGDTVNVPIDIAEKDQRLLLETADVAGINLTWTPEIHARLVEMQALGMGKMDVSSTLLFFARWHELRLKWNWAAPERSNANVLANPPTV